VFALGKLDHSRHTTIVYKHLLFQLHPCSEPTLPVRRRRKVTLAELAANTSVRPSSVDSYSRVIFPVLFALFHVVYWAINAACMQKWPEDAVMLHRK
jgi:hypothetical protein